MEDDIQADFFILYLKGKKKKFKGNCCKICTKIIINEFEGKH